MALVYKELEDVGRSMYLYFPNQERRTPWKRRCVTILRDGTDEASVRAVMEAAGLAELAEEYGIIFSFPNALEAGWNYDFSGETDEIGAFLAFQDACAKEDNLPLACNAMGIPTRQAMLSVWHPMYDTRYLIGLGSGAHMACTLAACSPANIAAVFALGGKLCEAARQRAVGAAVPICLTGSDRATRNYFQVGNETDASAEQGGWMVASCSRNPLQRVMVREEETTLTKELFLEVWSRLMLPVRRTNTSVYGDVEPGIDLQKAGFTCFLEDARLDEREKKPHTWFTHVPASVKGNPERKVPLLLFFHGGSDNPEEAAQMSRFHELGEREGFITVYPWGTDRTQWNSALRPDGEDDLGFSVALIRYMIENYPVDEQRVYLSGFSNGAAQAMTVAMLYPELIAAICPIDSNWPGERFGPGELKPLDIALFERAMQKKERFDYRMPVWYTYGSREISYPVFDKSSQQHQYDFWKTYNHIRVEKTPAIDNPDPCGCGVPGQVQERLRPSVRHPAHFYDVQRFYAEDGAHLNLYNYVVMHDKGHDIADMDPALGWNYVRQFKRLPDGSIALVIE